MFQRKELGETPLSWLLECDKRSKGKSTGEAPLSWLLECECIAKESVPFEEDAYYQRLLTLPIHTWEDGST